MKNFFISKSEVIGNFDHAARVVREDILISVKNSKLQRAILMRFDSFMLEARRTLLWGYLLPVRPAFKRSFDRLWSDNYFIMFDSRRDARIHNSASQFIEVVLRKLGEKHGLLDAPELVKSEHPM